METALMSVIGGLLVATITAFAYFFTEFRKEMAAALEGIRGEINAIRGEINAIRGEISEVRQVQAAQGEQLKAIQATQVDHGAQLAAIRAQQADHAERIARLEGARPAPAG